MVNIYKKFTNNIIICLQELVTKDRNHRRRKWLILGLLALITLVVVVAVIVLTAGTSSDERTAAQHLRGPPAITLEDFLDGRLSPHSFNATWVSGNLSFSLIIFTNKKWHWNEHWRLHCITSNFFTTCYFIIMENYKLQLNITICVSKATKCARFMIQASLQTQNIRWYAEHSTHVYVLAYSSSWKCVE